MIFRENIKIDESNKETNKIFFHMTLRFIDDELLKGIDVPDGLGICQVCGLKIELMEGGKHVDTHYYSTSGPKCSGSRKLDYKHKYLAKISEQFEEI